VTHIKAESRIRFASLVAAAACAGAVALGGSAFGYAAIATAQPGSGVWDMEDYEDCILRETLKTSDGVLTFSVVRSCCENSGGVWEDHGGGAGKCVAPAAQAPGSRSILPDLGNAPVVTKTPRRPIQVPSDIATAPAVSQAAA
jgi:hypothetical protein